MLQVKKGNVGIRNNVKPVKYYISENTSKG